MCRRRIVNCWQRKSARRGGPLTVACGECWWLGRGNLCDSLFVPHDAFGVAGILRTVSRAGLANGKIGDESFARHRFTSHRIGVVIAQPFLNDVALKCVPVRREHRISHDLKGEWTREKLGRLIVLILIEYGSTLGRGWSCR